MVAKPRTPLKLEIYARERVAHVWFVNAQEKFLEVFLLDGSTYRRAASFAGEEKVRAAPFAAIELDLGALWMP